MDYQATAKYIRTSTRKLRLIADNIRQMHPETALSVLHAMPKRATKPMMDVINSALANARQKQIDIASLRFRTIEVMGGPVMKRWRAVSRGQAHGYKKRMTHIRVVVTDDRAENQQRGAKGGNG